MRILILEHEPETPPALFAEWAHERRHELVVAKIGELDEWPEAADYDAIVSLGSDHSVHADPPDWVEPELQLLRAAHAQDVALLGICFGGQALGMALGAAVGAARVAEAGWRAIDTRDPGLILPGPWFLWHEDEFATPPGATVLSGTSKQTIAFALNRSLALQYHPEVDERLALEWIGGGRAKLDRQGIDSDELRRQVAVNAARARERAFEQFDRIEGWWQRSSSLDGPTESMKERR
jgi:GMP synthase-like glutamine amidotransferase